MRMSDSDADSDSFHSASEGEDACFDSASGTVTEKWTHSGGQCLAHGFTTAPAPPSVVHESEDVRREPSADLVEVVDNRASFDAEHRSVDRQLKVLPKLDDTSLSAANDGLCTERVTQEVRKKSDGNEGGGNSGSRDPDGWDDWGVDDDELPNVSDADAEVDNEWEDWGTTSAQEEIRRASEESPTAAVPRAKTVSKGNEGTSTTTEKAQSSFWGWSELTSVVASVGEGLSTAANVMESSLGLPSPESLAKKKFEEEKAEVDDESPETKAEKAEGSFGFLTGIGTHLVSGSLDVLETLGKKTFEKLTVAKQGSERRRFIFAPEEGQNLSDILREVRNAQRAECECSGAAEMFSTSEPKRESTFIDLFEKYGGFVHLEGLEMLSASYTKQLPSHRKREVESVLSETLSEPMEDTSEDENFSAQLNRIFGIIRLPYNGKHLIDCDSRCKQRCAIAPSDLRSAFDDFLEVTAELTANGVQGMHKLGQLMLIAECPPPQSAVASLLALIGRRISFFSNVYALHLNHLSLTDSNVEELITSVFLTANDAFVYVQQSVKLLRPLFIRKRV